MLLSHILPVTYQAQQQKSRAKDQMNFQREMSNTSYQRQMDDMRAAGLNPILAAKMGGASTPSGALAGTPNVSQTMASTVQQATQMRMAHAQVATQQQTAKKMSLENEMLRLDLDDMKDKGLSPLAYKHTPSNVGFSMLLKNMIDKYRDIKNNPLTINDLTSSVKQLLGGEYEGDMQNFDKYKEKAKSLTNKGFIPYFSDKGRKAKPPYYIMVPPYTKNPNNGVRIYYAPSKK